MAKPPIDSSTRPGRIGEPDVVVPLATVVVVLSGVPVNAGIDAVVDVLDDVVVEEDAGGLAGSAAGAVVVGAAVVDVVAAKVVVVDGNVVVVSNEVDVVVELDPGSTCAPAGRHIRSSAPATVTTMTSRRTGVVCLGARRARGALPGEHGCR